MSDILLARMDEALASQVRSRLETAGYSVAGPFEDYSRMQSSDARIAIVSDHPVGLSVPVIKLVAESDRVSEPHGIHAVVTLPLRGLDLENCVAIALHRLANDPNVMLVNAMREYALFLLSPEGTVLTWNPGGENVHGYRPEEILGQSYKAFYVPEDLERGVPERELRMAESEGSADDTRWLLRSNGETFWAEGRTVAIRDRSGKLKGYAKITRDATERRRLEQQLERSNDELQRFAYTVSHDLQEPLRTIRSYAELVHRRYSGAIDRDADEFIQFMVDAAGRMSQLLKDLLAYSQAGRPDRTRPEPTHAANILEWAIMNVDRLAKETNTVITHDPLPLVEADQTQLTQVFQNLLTNAIKYRSEEPPRIHISAQRVDAMYEFSVSDNGIGVDPEHHERIFGVFKRLHGKEVAGTGIGLAICRKIIESHGGRIWIDSDLGRGATFRFTLPASD